jgi:crotonobetainyl-CoA:carnitine CoA-transferase CaiB-like acyl-CoA transferase
VTADRDAVVDEPLLTGLRIVVVDAGLPGGYLGRLFADQGADVVHIEPADGTVLGRRSASPGSPPGALYRHLTAGTRRLRVDPADPAAGARIQRIVGECDAVVLDAVGAGRHPTLTLKQVEPWCAGRVLASISLWGAGSPAAARAGTEFTLQAAVGGTGARGQSDTPPLGSDGDRGFWHTGAYAAIAVLAALGTATDDRPALLDISAFECMVTAWNLYEWIRRLLWNPPRDLKRWTDVPGIERVKDGWVGFSLVTPGQWHAYCDMTQAPELAAEPSFTQLTGRSTSHERIRAATEPWLSKHTVDEVVADAAARRIPAVPVVAAGQLPQLEHFRQRGTFLPATPQLPQRPAPPYKVNGVRRYADDAVADLGDHREEVWPARAWTVDALDFAELAVLDVSGYYAGPYATQVLAMLGADVLHVESAASYDGMRNVSTRPRSDNHWWEFSYVYQGAQAGKRSVAVDLTKPGGAAVLGRLLSKYDIVLENFSRDVAPRLGLVYDDLAARQPGVIFVRSPGFGLDGPWSHLRAYAMTGDQISGLAWRTGWPGDRPTAPRTIGDSFTALHSAFAIVAALRRRARTGRGAFIEVSSMEVSISLTAEEAVEWSANGIEMGRAGNRSHRIAPQGVYAAAGDDDDWVALSIDSDESWHGLLLTLGECVADPGAASWKVDERMARHDQIDGWIEHWFSARPADAGVARLQSNGIAAERVIGPSNLAEDERLRASGYFSRFTHPLAGPLDYTGLPWLANGARPGPRHCAPLFGQDTNDVLAEVGMSADEISRLAGEGVVGGTPPVDSPAKGQ